VYQPLAGIGLSMNTIRTNSRRREGGITRLFLLTLGMALAAASCGQQGPLYLPQKDTRGADEATVSREGEPASAEAESGAGDRIADEDENEETP
jgi:predicted small lipoprotein YifL